MNRNFREFIKNDIVNFYEAAGVSGSGLFFPTSFPPLTNFLSLLPTDDLKAQALMWIVSKGMMEASLNRDKLFKLVQEQMNKISAMPNLKMNTAHGIKNVPSTQKVVGEMARNVVGKYGRDEETIFSHLFHVFLT